MNQVRTLLSIVASCFLFCISANLQAQSRQTISFGCGASGSSRHTTCLPSGAQGYRSQWTLRTLQGVPESGSGNALRFTIGDDLTTIELYLRRIGSNVKPLIGYAQYLLDPNTGCEERKMFFRPTIRELDDIVELCQ